MADVRELNQDLKEEVSKFVETVWEYFRMRQKNIISNKVYLERLTKIRETDSRKFCNIARKLLNAKYTQSISKLIKLTEKGNLEEILKDAKERLKSLHEATSNQEGTNGNQQLTTREMTKKKKRLRKR